MKKLILILFFIWTSSIAIFGQQETITIHGMIKDSVLKSPVASVSITRSENLTASITDENGHFKIVVLALPCTLHISHLGYFSKEVIFSDPTFREIPLCKKSNLLPELSVTTEKPVAITADEPLFIKDYAIMENKILAIAYKNKILSQSRLYVMTFKGDTIFSVPLNKPDRLYQDCLEHSYFINNTDAYQLLLDSASVDFLFPFPSKEFLTAFDLLVAGFNEKLYLKKYSLKKQLLEYIEYDESKKLYSSLITVENEMNERMLLDRGRMVCSSDDPETQARFEDLAFYQPVFAPLLKIKDTIRILNFEDSWIASFDDSGNVMNKVFISFHKDKNWKKELFIDDANGKVYTMFRKNGISMLKEINLRNGTIENTIEIPDLPFVDSIKINNGILFFLYTDHSKVNECRMLYSMRI